MKNILILLSILFVICSCDDDKKERISTLRLDSMHGVYELDTHKSVGISINECVEQKNEEYVYYIVADFSKEDSCHFYTIGIGVKKESYAYSFDGDNITLIDGENKIDLKLKKREIGKDYKDYYFERKIGDGIYEYRRFSECRNNYDFERNHQELKGIVAVPKDRFLSRKDICNVFYGQYLQEEDLSLRVFRRYSKNGTFKEVVKNMVNYERVCSNGTYKLTKNGELDTLYLNYENGDEKVECISYDVSKYYVIEADTIVAYFTDDEYYTRFESDI